ncbi:N,N'-diacetylchitobiose transport system substrate-binding protein [Geodermatophilus amargosae]|jgi:N,N'-diacetylchitobiose transport system substrate-binding protein|uniref:N,N'-diacetylchitobiose transport system substrate-binding protein n=1 Tax=Geodermatophilus amargosae TaxID=1296565 RepID=A0A1I6X4H7_9ACTN|nr:extracellular solute-binding protein [Geodermatophilus amargosae]SFT33258.1 N,N'-diacetylchitobiose transport system substrate-binding protein [Geodermatophilus amargosae]
MRRVRTGGLAAAAVASLLAVSACGGGETAEASSDTEVRLWLNGTDTPQELRDYLVETFEADHEGMTLVIEEQDWSGLVPRLQTALSSEDQTPDLVEIGNTQSPTFTYAGAFTELTDVYDELGGDDLLPGFVDAGTAEGTLYAVPYYSGARAVFYRKDLFEQAGVAVPTTLAEFRTAAIALQQANPSPDFSGFWFPGQDWYNGVAWVFSNGGDLAVQEGDRWVGALSSPESQAALAEVQDLFTNATRAPRDADSNEPWVAFNNGQAAMFSAPTWARSSIALPECDKGVDPDDESPEAQALLEEQQACNEEITGVFPLPGTEPGSSAPVFAGGSNIAIPTMSQHQDEARDLLRIIFSEEYQTMLAENGLIPGNSQYADALGNDAYAQAALAAARNAKLTPAAERWADVEGARILEDFFQQVASGADVAQAAAEADRLMEETLN